MPSNAKFGYFFAAFFTLVGLYSYSRWFILISVVAATVALLFFGTTIFAPKTLTTLNRIWYESGLLLGKISSPIVLSIIFYLMITPVALIIRLFGRDELKIKKLTVQSYWVNRNPTGPSPDSFKNQY